MSASIPSYLVQILLVLSPQNRTFALIFHLLI
jgi:hypothetical protein